MTACRALRALCMALFPGVLVLALYACNTVNPMSRMFMFDFHITNMTSHSILVTPVGATGPSGHRTRLPLLADVRFYWPARQSGRLAIAPNETRKFTYDWDDIQFSEILVEWGDEARLLVVNAEPTRDQYRPPPVDHFTITDMQTLPPASHEIVALSKERMPWGTIYLLASVIAVPTFWWCGRRIRRVGSAVV